MRISGYSFGSLRAEGMTYDHDLIIDHGRTWTRQKSASPQVPQRLRAHPAVGRRRHPLACRQLVIGTGVAGALPVMNEVHDEARAAAKR